MAGQPQWTTASSQLRFRDDTQITLGMTPLDEGSAHSRDLYLTTHNTHRRPTSMLPAGFKRAILADERPQVHALDRAESGIGQKHDCLF